MSLFNNLYGKKKDISLENYFTEIIAGLFLRSPEVLYSWLIKLGVLTQAVQFSGPPVVISQNIFGCNRPDLFIELTEMDGKTIILVESKISYKLHDNQLERYAKLLKDEFQKAHKRCLVFICHTYEPVDTESIFKDIPEGVVNFYQANWSDFYHILKTFPQDALVNEICQFMKELGMAQENQFGPKDISALSRIPKLFNLMEACLAGEVLEKFKKLTGNQRARPEYNASWGAYGLFYDVETWSLALGFFFGELEESPRTALEFYAKQSRSMPRFLLLQNDLLKQDGWEPYDWDGLDENSIGPESEPCVFHSKELNTFLDETNVPLIKQYFLNRMDEFESVKGIYRKLPW